MEREDLQEGKPLEVLYQDDHYVAINKPPGLLVHRTRIDAKEKRFALQILREQLHRHVYPIHRLDKATSGVLLFAFSEDGIRQMQREFESGQVQKEYYAIVRGFTPEEGFIDKSLKKRMDSKSATADNRLQEAVTYYKTISRSELPIPSHLHTTTRYSLVLLNPKTGRWHQLRRHLAHINHPIIGDTTHGDNKRNRIFLDRFGFRRLWLTATQLKIRHPITNEKLNIKAEPWSDFQQAMKVTNLAA